MFLAVRRYRFQLPVVVDKGVRGRQAHTIRFVSLSIVGHDDVVSFLEASPSSAPASPESFASPSGELCDPVSSQSPSQTF